VDHSVGEIDVMPLQAQAFGYTETCAGGQERQSAFRLSEVRQDCIRLFPEVRIIASYPLVVLQRTKRSSWLLAAMIPQGSCGLENSAVSLADRWLRGCFRLLD
jgi:hypothetical protein